MFQQPSAVAASHAPTSPRHPLRLVAALTLAIGLQGAALASPASDIADLKKSLAAMKADYDKRIGAARVAAARDAGRARQGEGHQRRRRARGGRRVGARSPAGAAAVADVPPPAPAPAVAAVDTSVNAPRSAARPAAPMRSTRRSR